MFKREYKVKGDDVNDFMVMQDHAYCMYIQSTLMAFLTEKGYSKHEINSCKIGFKTCMRELTYRKHLMFTQHFFINLEPIDLIYNKQKIRVKSRFFNAQNELCVTAITQFYLNIDYKNIKTLHKSILGVH